MRPEITTFPGCDDAPLARALLRLLAEGRPVTTGALAQAIGRTTDDVLVELRRWPNVERDGDGRVVGFSGLTLNATAHRFELDGHTLYTWCAWDTLFLPALLKTAARVRSTCAVTGTAVELEVTPDGVRRAEPADLYVSFPPQSTTDVANIVGTFCCHVQFLAGAEAARQWSAGHPAGTVLDVSAAFHLDCQTVLPLTAGYGGRGCDKP